MELCESCKYREECIGEIDDDGNCESYVEAEQCPICGAIIEGGENHNHFEDNEDENEDN